MYIAKAGISYCNEVNQFSMKNTCVLFNINNKRRQKKIPYTMTTICHL